MAFYLSVAAIIFALLSAILWFLSSLVKFPFGYDMDQELSKAMKMASKRNAWAAIFTALAVISQAFSMILNLCKTA